MVLRPTSVTRAQQAAQRSWPRRQPGSHTSSRFRPSILDNVRSISVCARRNRDSSPQSVRRDEDREDRNPKFSVSDWLKSGDFLYGVDREFRPYHNDREVHFRTFPVSGALVTSRDQASSSAPEIAGVAKKGKAERRDTMGNYPYLPLRAGDPESSCQKILHSGRAFLICW